MKDFKKENIEKRKKAEQEKQNMKIGSAMGQIATGILAASAIYASKEEQTADDNANNESLLAESVLMSGENIPFEYNNTSANEHEEETETDVEGNTPGDDSIPFEEDSPEDNSEKMSFVAASVIEEDNALQEQASSFVLEAEPITDDTISVADNSNVDVLEQLSTLDTDETSELDSAQDNVLVDEEVPSESFMAEEDISSETAEVESEMVLEFEDYEDEVLLNATEVEAELVPEINYEDETALDIENEVISVVHDEEVDLEFEDYIDSDDEYESVSVLFDEDEESTLLSYEDNLESSRSTEDGVIDDDSELSDFENNADVSSFM